MSTGDGDEKTCYSLSAAAVGCSPRIGGQLGCRPSLATWSIAPRSIFLGGLGVCFDNWHFFLLLLNMQFFFYKDHSRFIIIIANCELVLYCKHSRSGPYAIVNTVPHSVVNIQPDSKQSVLL